MKLLCLTGLHEWGKEPVKQDFLRSTGRHFAFASEAKQLGTFCCHRKGCDAMKPVYRTGWLSLGGGKSSKWKKASITKQEEINSLPVL